MLPKDQVSFLNHECCIQSDKSFEDDNPSTFSAAVSEYNREKEYIISGLTPETKYKLRISATNEAGTTDFSDDILIETSEPKGISVSIFPSIL